SAEDVVLLATITPPQGSPTVMQFELLAGEHGVFTVDFGQMPQEVIDHYTQELGTATDPLEEEAWTLALAGALYQRLLSGDLEHLAGLRWQRLIQLGTAVLAVQRGAISTAADGTPLLFSKGPMSLDLGAMPLGLFPASGAAGSSVPTLELLGSHGSFLEGEALSQVIGGEQITAVTFLTRAVREGQTLTLVDAGNVDAALAEAELSEEAEAHVRAGVAQGKIAWIAENQLPVGTWQTSGYILEDPETGAGGYFVTFERLVEGLEANIVFHSPQDLDVVTAPIDVVATIEGEAIDSWTLSYQFVGEGQSVVLATGTESVSNATLAQFDPTLLLNGLYDIVLTAREIAGQSVSRKISVSAEGNMKIGNFTLRFFDLAIPLSGLDIEIVRTYDSRQREMKGDFGHGWTLDIRQGRYQNNRPPGDGWQIVNPGGPLGLPCSAIIENKFHLTTIRLSDQEIYRFRLKLTDPSVLFGGCQARAVFEWVDGPLPGASLEILGNSEVFYKNNSHQVIDINSFDVFEPNDVKLTTRDGRVFYLNIHDGVTRLEDPNRNYLEITPTGIHHSSGRGISIERDANNRIFRIIDPQDNEITYTYDNGSGDLFAVTNQENVTTRFSYSDDHYLTEIEDPLGNRAVRADYDDHGRLTRTTDALGRTTELSHDLNAQREEIIDRLGHSQIIEYDDRGNVIRHTDAAGNVTTRTYDQQDNLLTVSDDLGHTTTRTYDSSNNLRIIVDPLGNTTSFTYNTRGQILTTTDPRGNITTNAYDSSGNLTSITDDLGNRTKFTYDISGNLITREDAQGGVTQLGYNQYGNVERGVDALGHEVTYILDAAGRRLSETMTRSTPNVTQTLTTSYSYDNLGRITAIKDPDGSLRRTTYDTLGRIIEITNNLGQITRSTLDAMGRPTVTTYPDGSTEMRTYDSEGRLLSQTDREGRKTEFIYDARGLQSSIVFPDGSTISRQYDSRYQLIAETDARGYTTTYEYDAAGRRTAVVNALGDRTTLAYDASSNLTAVVDALGNTTTFEYDSLNLRVRSNFMDGTSTATIYDKLGRPTVQIDEAGLATHYSFDIAGRMTSTLDALGNSTSYTYDEIGNLLSRTNANGCTTKFEYDIHGQRIKRILPDGSTEEMTYDASGNIVSRNDFKNATTTYRYNLNQQLTEKTFANGSTVSYTYTPGGQRRTVTDSRGTTTYSYDSRRRLTDLIYPDGRQLSYEYDSNGNRRTLLAKIGTEILITKFTYDPLNRLDTVTDPDGRVYYYQYDANGNRISVKQPTGTETQFTYDMRNRLTALLTRTSADDVLQSYAYSLDLAGNRTRIEDHEGVAYDYTYDQLYRLVGEKVTADSVLIYENNFGYDPVGNRLTQVKTNENGSTITNYSYDIRERLLTAEDITYTWDQNGNLVSQSGNNGANYNWDFEDRLVKISLANQSVIEHAYDADGNTVRTSVTPPAGTPVVTNFLVDASDPISHNVAESDNNGTLSAYYVRGAELLANLRPEGPHFYATDGFGSVRLLTDTDEIVTDRYDFSAYGELVGHEGENPNAFLFTGQRLDISTGFYDLRARWMDPALGRFVAMDPLLSNTADTNSFHPYIYANADPVNNWDPSGKFSVSFKISVAALSIAVAVMTIPILVFRSTFNPVTVRIQPIIAHQSGWDRVMAQDVHLYFAQRIFTSQATNIYLDYRGIRIDRTRMNREIKTEEAQQLIRRYHEKNTIALIFVTDILPFKDGRDLIGIAQGASPSGDNWTTCRRGARGAVISLDAYYTPVTTAHELAHAIGCLPDRNITNDGYPGLLMWESEIISVGNVGWGTLLEQREVDQLHYWARQVP
ncbi:MAG: RHS repeat-associated core domain-containing protein, partial [bacterium]|nr:RHS repeat-associated core domain-containing protein [bacterium]